MPGGWPLCGAPDQDDFPISPVGAILTGTARVSAARVRLVPLHVLFVHSLFTSIFISVLREACFMTSWQFLGRGAFLDDSFLLLLCVFSYNFETVCVHVFVNWHYRHTLLSTWWRRRAYDRA